MTIRIEQAMCCHTSSEFRCLARSAGFSDDWLPEVERLCTGFGQRPAGVTCPSAVFAQPLGPKHVAVVQVADQVDAILAFRFLVLPLKEYVRWIGDPFAIADRFPPDWQSRGTLPVLQWAAEPLPARTVEATQQILKNGDSPTLLGGVQALVDGGRMIYERPAPAPELVRSIWALLPHSTRACLWPASFAFTQELDFQVLVVPKARSVGGFLTEEQAGDYPQGRYELNLQIAAESGDQDELDRLFYRRSSAETLRLVLMLVAAAALLAVIANWAQRSVKPPQAPAVQQVRLPFKERYPPLAEAHRQELTQALHQLAQRLMIELTPSASAEALLEAIDRKLGPADPAHDCGPVARLGDVERQLRALLWKQRVPRFDDESLNVVELTQKLQEHLAASESR